MIVGTHLRVAFQQSNGALLFRAGRSMSRFLLPQLFASGPLIFGDDLGSDLIDNWILTLRDCVLRTVPGPRTGQKAQTLGAAPDP